MSQHLCISATFLAGRYHGKEWPPSPARLFQALVAGVKTGVFRQQWPSVESVLRGLEQLPAPEIVARNADRLSGYRISVPNNDTDRAAREWALGKEFDASRLRTMKEVQPREIGASSDGKPHVYYFWKLPGDAPDIASVQQLASFLHTLGWGVDMAYADAFLADDQYTQTVSAQDGYSKYVPSPTGMRRPIPVPGYLDDICAAYQRYCKRHTSTGVDAFTRARNYGEQPYRRVLTAMPPVATFLLRQLDNTGAWFSMPWAFSMRVAAWMRHAVAEALREEGYNELEINEYVLGHGGDGHRRHMSFVPLPSIGGPHADGAVRRVMLVEPGDADGAISELLQWKLAPSVLHLLLESNGGPRRTAPVCSLAEGSRNDPVISSYLPSAPRRVWHSVTPLILHGHNSLRGKFSLRKTEELLYQAFNRRRFGHACPRTSSKVAALSRRREISAGSGWTGTSRHRKALRDRFVCYSTTRRRVISRHSALIVTLVWSVHRITVAIYPQAAQWERRHTTSVRRRSSADAHFLLGLLRHLR
ncbi:MAG: type I-U CRISPR-associated protein Cas5/Cas6 [Acidobacteria bacterium]|nr:MAG: type I-U CRISPR-associated protein Cas5/Cas6 [Acidobacteriota bacterium]